MRQEKIKILIVEEHLNEVKDIKNYFIKNTDILRSNIKNTADAREAIAIIKIEEPHLIFIDLNLATTKEGRGDGVLLLKEITEIYEYDQNYQPFKIAISAAMKEQTENDIAKYSHVQFGKHQPDYPALAFQRYLISIEVPFKHTTNIDETDYMTKITSLIKIELAPFDFPTLPQQSQAYIIELICLAIPAVDKRTIKLARLYQKIAEKFGICSYYTVRSTITRAFKHTFLKTDNFHEKYHDGIRAIQPKQKEFFQYIAENVKNKI